MSDTDHYSELIHRLDPGDMITIWRFFTTLAARNSPLREHYQRVRAVLQDALIARGYGAMFSPHHPDCPCRVCAADKRAL